MTTDTDLETEVRAMLHRRASDITEAAVDPELPTGLRVAVDDAPRRRDHRLLLAAAAVLAVMALAVGAALTLGDGGAEQDVANEPRMSGATAPPVAAVPGAPVLPDLPAGTDLGTSPPLWTGAGAPADVAREYLTDRLQLGLTEWDLDVDEQTEGSWAVVRWRLVTGSLDEPTLPVGGVHLRLDPDGWSVVAALTDGVVLSDVTRFEGGVVNGTVHDPGDELVAIDVTTLDGEPVPGSPRRGTRGTLLPGQHQVGTAAEGRSPVSFAVPVGIDDGPVALRASQVGGSILSISEVVLLAPEEDPAASPTTQAPLSGEATTTTLPAHEGVAGVFWTPPAAVDPTDDHAVAMAFVAEVTGDAPSGASGDHTVPMEETRLVFVELGALEIQVVLGRTPQGWGVMEAGGGGVTTAVGTEDEIIVPVWDSPAVPDGAATYATLVHDGEQGWFVDYTNGPAGQVPDDPSEYTIGDPPLAALDAAVVVFRDADGEVVGVIANPLG